jgi:PAS domain S-box-containing protein
MSIKNVIVAEPDASLSLDRVKLDQEKLIPFMDTVSDAVWLVDVRLQIAAQNQVANKILGWSQADVIGRSVSEFIPADNQVSGGLTTLFSQAIEQRKAMFLKDILLVTKNGQQILVSGKISPFVKNGQVAGAICAFQKITPEHRNLYLRFEFADMASHLLRTPLSFIQTSTDLLLSANLEADQQRIMLTRILKQSQRLKVFVNELLKILRTETEGVQANIESVALVPLIERILNLIRYEQPHHIFNYTPNGSLPRVAADPTKTELVLFNLLLSAVRRCPNGGNIIVHSECQGNEIIVSISDNGEAIPDKLLSKAFWQFYPIDDDNGKMPSSYQLGLYTTKQFVELQNGRIWAESQSDRGSKFSFSMPIWEQGQ